MDNRTLAMIVLGSLLFIIPIARIWDAWGDYQTAATKVEGMRQATVVPMKTALLNRKVIDLPVMVENLFTFSFPPPSPSPSTASPAPAPVPAPVAAPVPPGSSLGDIVGDLRGKFERQFQAVEIPEPPRFDLGKIKVRGFFRRKGIQKALVLFDGRLLLVTTGDRIGNEVVVEKCDFSREELTIRLVRTGAVQQLLADKVVSHAQFAFNFK